MSTSNEKAISILNELIEVCKDGELGFTSASEGVQDSELKILLKQYATQRSEFCNELREEVRALGGKPENSGTFEGTIHRGWIDLKAVLTGKNDHAIISECEKGEDAAKEAYEKVLNGNALPGTVLPLVQNQYMLVVETHDRVQDIRDLETTSSR